MELKNTSCLPDHFVRAMIRWCCKQVGFPYKDISQVAFYTRNTQQLGSACLGSRHIRINVPIWKLVGKGEASRFVPMPFGEIMELFRSGNPTIQCKLYEIVETMAHEIAHLYVYRNFGTASEQEADAQGVLIRDDFSEDADALLAAWSKEPARRESKPKPTAAERREQGNRELLSKWERKLKAAQNKVKKYRAKVRYYDRKRAAKKGKA